MVESTTRKASNEDDRIAIKFLCSVVNTFGTGQHPYVTPENYTNLVPHYARECLDKAEKALLTQSGLWCLKYSRDNLSRLLPDRRDA